MTTRPDSTPARDEDSRVDYDVVVVGGGAAGLSASVFTARAGLETLVCDRGTSAIRQCAHLENYLGFPGGISPDRFLELGRTQATHEGATVREQQAVAITDGDHGFAVETQDSSEYLATYVLVATAYDGDVFDAFEGQIHQEPTEGFVRTDQGRTGVEGLYVAGWLTDDTAHQAIVNAGDGARAALALVRDDMSDRYWPAVGERYVDWVVDEGRYGGDGWEDHIDEWFEREMLPADAGEETLQQARADLAAEFLDRQLSAEEKRRRQRAGQRHLLANLDDDLIREYYEAELAPESSPES